MWKEDPNETQIKTQLLFSKRLQKKKRQQAEVKEKSDAVYKVQQFLESQGLPNDGKSIEQIEKEIWKETWDNDPEKIMNRKRRIASQEMRKALRREKTIKTSNLISINRDYIEIPENLNFPRPNYQQRLRKWKLTPPKKARENNNKILKEFQDNLKTKDPLKKLQEDIATQEKEQLKIENNVKKAEKLKTREYREIKNEINSKVTEKMKDLFAGLYGYEPTKAQYWQFYRKADSIKRTKRLYLEELLREYGLEEEIKVDIDQIDESKYTVDELWEIYNPPELLYHGVVSISSNTSELKQLTQIEDIIEIPNKVKAPVRRCRKYNIGEQTKLEDINQSLNNPTESYEVDEINEDGLIPIKKYDNLLLKYNAKERSKRRVLKKLNPSIELRERKTERQRIKNKIKDLGL